MSTITTTTMLKDFGSDLESSSSSSSSTSSFDFSATMSPGDLFQGTPSVADSEELSEKPSKKRRSWGQQLPTPTTNLPPRKRAKTEAEKEQRRIERVIRNRLAAHSSRERKRKEVEQLEDNKSTLELHNDQLREQLIKLTSSNRSLLQLVKELKAELGRPDEEINIKEEMFEPLTPPYTPAGRSVSPSVLPQSLSVLTDMTQHPAVSVPEEQKTKEESEVMSRRDSVISSAALTTASTCHSSPLPEQTFDDLFGTACETPTVLTEFDPSFLMDLDPKKNKFSEMFPVDSFNFDLDVTKPFVEDFVNLDGHNDTTYNEDHFVIFSNEIQG